MESIGEKPGRPRSFTPESRPVRSARIAVMDYILVQRTRLLHSILGYLAHPERREAWGPDTQQTDAVTKRSYFRLGMPSELGCTTCRPHEA
jgi:hypothetical protein